MMVGRDVQLVVDKKPAQPGKPILKVKDLSVRSKLYHRDAVRKVSFDVRAGEIVCIAGIDGNGQTELVHGITGLEKLSGGHVYMYDVRIPVRGATMQTRSLRGMVTVESVETTKSSIRERALMGFGQHEAQFPEPGAQRHRRFLIAFAQLLKCHSRPPDTGCR